MSNLLGNTPLEKAMQSQLERLGPPPFDAADRKYAAEIQATLSAEDIASSYARVAMPVQQGHAAVRLRRALRHQGRADDRLDRRRRRELGGADRAGARARPYAIGTPGHSWQITAQGKSGQAKKGMVNAAKVMAGLAVDALGDPALIARAKADLKARTEVTPYDCPLPAELAPPLPGWRRSRSWSGGVRLLRHHADLARLDLQRQVLRVDAALREAAGDEPQAGLRRAHNMLRSSCSSPKPQIGPTRSAISSPNSLRDQVLLALVAGRQHDQIGGMRSPTAHPRAVGGEAVDVGELRQARSCPRRSGRSSRR